MIATRAVNPGAIRMATKLDILEHIGQRSLRLPELINRGLAAHDRLRYYLMLLNTAYGYAQAPVGAVPDLRGERESADVPDPSLDQVVAGSHMVTGGAVHIPGAAEILAHVFADVREMLEPVTVSAAMHGELAERAGVYTRRFEDQVARIPAVANEHLTVGLIETLTRVTSNGHDTLHRLVTDLHWELNRLQVTVSVELLDGAHVYGLTDGDRKLVRAFMRGVHETAPLRLDHPGLETVATHDGTHLSIENDLDVADAHVVVIQVSGLAVSVVYTDVHRARARFFRDLLEPHHLTWTEGTETGEFETCTGAYEAADQTALEQFLTAVGSRLVFLIGWSRARKRLSRFVRKSDAGALLKWAADNNIGHQGFLRAGDLRLIHTALSRVASTQLPFGARLDEILGREVANRFLMSVLQITASGFKRRLSARLIDDEIEAELLRYLQRSDRSLLGAIADHAVVLAGMVERIRGTVPKLKAHDVAELSRTAVLLRSWKSEADSITDRARRSVDTVDHAPQLRRLLAEGDRAVKVFEEAGFTLTLVPDSLDAEVAGLLDRLVDLAGHAAREYVSCLEDACELSRSTERPELDRFLVTVERLATMEASCDEAERKLRERVLRGNGLDFRTVYVVAELTRQLDRATDSLVHSGLLVRDYVLSVSPGN